MRRKDVKKYSNRKNFFSVLVFIVIFLLGLILPKSAKADNEEKYLNYFYVMAINNALSVINPQGNGKQDISKVKHPVLALLGVDFSNPISIITKEISYFNNTNNTASVDNESNGEKREVLILNPFKLGDNQVSKLDNKVGGTSIADIYNPKLKQTLNKAKPPVLIYHSHTTESYLASDNDKSTDTFNMDLTQGVCEVGDEIANDLEKNYGIAAINDDTLHNVGDYQASYKKSRITLNKYLKVYGDFDIIIDLHRDGIQSTRKNEKTKINGVDVAKIMFVMTDENPRYAKQKKLVTSMIGISNKLYPGLMDNRQVYLYHKVYNFFSQDRSDNAMLIEVGNNNTTIIEAKNTGLFLSRIIAEQLNGKK